MKQIKCDFLFKFQIIIIFFFAIDKNSGVCVHTDLGTHNGNKIQKKKKSKLTGNRQTAFIAAQNV